MVYRFACLDCEWYEAGSQEILRCPRCNSPRKIKAFSSEEFSIRNVSSNPFLTAADLIMLREMRISLVPK